MLIFMFCSALRLKFIFQEPNKESICGGVELARSRETSSPSLVEERSNETQAERSCTSLLYENISGGKGRKIKTSSRDMSKTTVLASVY